MNTNSIELLGKPFEVLWQSDDRRRLANRATCYELVSLQSLKSNDDDALRRRLPAKIENCWIVNPHYHRDPPADLQDWLETGYDGEDFPPHAFTPAGEYLPPEARGLPVEPDESLKAGCDAGMIAASYVAQIVKEHFRQGRDEPHPHAASRFEPGIPIFKATFENGEVLYLQNVEKCAVPDAAKAKWEGQANAEALAQHKAKLQAVADSVQQAACRSLRTEVELHQTKATLAKAEEAASLTLREAVEKWNRLDLPGTAADTRARIKEAVAIYCANPDKRSLAKIANEFHVSRTTVSRWFKRFTKATGCPVVQHVRHESVKARLRAEAERNRRQGAADESGDDPTDE
ncbi:MAG: helix-turn-helix transcriptional regulator [Verrucomicrobia bacterium]|nr:helix-turn-helix transcriptional regulator [Verrucomicrobiota bacterium]